MLSTLALVFLQRPADGAGAADAARRFLERMGVRTVGLNHLQETRDARRWGGHGDRMWSVGFDLAGGGWITANVDERGEVFYASGPSRNGPNLDDATARRFADRLMARVPGAVPVRFGAISKGAAAGASAQYDAIVDGLRYFNLNPTYGYSFSFDRNGGLTWFGHQDRLPPPAAHVPKVSRARAVAKLESVWRSRRPASWPSPLRVEAELGLYARKGEPKARLVWHGEVFDVGDGRHIQHTALNTFVDATTGQTFEADDR